LPLDTITLKSLEFYGKHGYYDEERQEGNHFELDVIAKGDFKAAIKEDDLDQTFNYEIVKEVAKRVFIGPSEKLIESLCSRIGNEIFERSTITKELTISLRKLNPPIGIPAEYAEITMTWNR
jgi:dihydroneopterin aldolase